MSNQKIVKVSLNEGRKIIVKNPVGAEITMIIDAEGAESQYSTLCVSKLKPGVTLKPAHSHKDIEEIIHVLEGQGEVWIEGQVCKIKKGDSMLFPANSIHSTKNTGSGDLSLLCFFSSSQYRKEGAYCTHEVDKFW